MTSPRLFLYLTIAIGLAPLSAVHAQVPPSPPAAPGVATPPAPPQEPRGPRPLRPLRGRDNGPGVGEPFSRTLKVGANSALLVGNTRGDITVTAAGAGQIEVSAVKRARGTDDEAKRRLAGAPIDVHATGNRVEVQFDPESGGVQADFTIKVPSDCAVDLRAVSGDIRVTNVKGELRTQVVSGNVTLDGTSRIGVIKTVSGNVQITNGGADTALSISTVSGNLVANSLGARGLDFETVSGDLRLAGWTGERINARSVNGDFEVAGSVAKGGRYDVESHSGDVRLVLAEQPGFEIEATTFSGTIGIDFAIKNENAVSNGRGRGLRAVRGTYGDGSAHIRVQTFNGDIQIVKK